MTKMTFPTFISITLSIIALSFSTHSLAKKRCKPLLDKLHSIQSMQRKGYSLKRGQTLRVKEDKARDKWWQCEHSSLAKFKEKYGGKKEKTKKSKDKKQVKSRRYYTKVNKIPTYSQNSGSVFNQSSAIVIKSKYEGDMRLAWLEFYQQPTKCQRPKNISVFAYCSENKLQQQSDFEQEYSH